MIARRNGNGSASCMACHVRPRAINAHQRNLPSESGPSNFALDRTDAAPRRAKFPRCSTDSNVRHKDAKQWPRALAVSSSGQDCSATESMRGCYIRFVGELIEGMALAEPCVSTPEGQLAFFSEPTGPDAQGDPRANSRWRRALALSGTQVFIESKKSPLVLVCFSLSIRNSMASIVPIGARMRRSTKIFCRSCLATSRSSLRVPDFRMSMAG